MVREVLLLGNSLLYEKSNPVYQHELPQLPNLVQDLHDTLLAFRKIDKTCDGIAAPQIGVLKRVFYVYKEVPILFINPLLTFPQEETIEIMDTCMSFPNLQVRVPRYTKIHVAYRDIHWQNHDVFFEGEMAALLQHEYDHLNGILSIMRAVDNRSFFFK